MNVFGRRLIRALVGQAASNLGGRAGQVLGKHPEYDKKDAIRQGFQKVRVVLMPAERQAGRRGEGLHGSGK